MTEERFLTFPIDTPLSIIYDDSKGTVSVTSQVVMSDKTQAKIGFVLLPAAAVELLQALQQIETQSQKPPSMHAKQQMKQ